MINRNIVNLNMKSNLFCSNTIDNNNNNNNNVRNIGNKKTIFKAFIDTYFELLDFMKLELNNNIKFQRFYRKNHLLKRTNVKLFIQLWYTNINVKYGKEIIENNIDFFLVNNFEEEKSTSKYYGIDKEYGIQECIESMKEMYHTQPPEKIDAFISYIRNLTILVNMYFEI